MNITRLRFGIGNNAQPYCLYGFHAPELGFTWSNGAICAVKVPVPSNEPCMLVVKAKPFVAPPTLTAARIRILVDGQPGVEISVMQDFVICIPLDCKTKGSPIDVAFIADDATRPIDIGQHDVRALGIALCELAIVETSSALTEIMSPLGELENEEDREIARWAAIELLPWAVLKTSRAKLARKFSALNIAGWCQTFRIAGNRAVALPKPAAAEVSDVITQRAAAYNKFFNEVALDVPYTLQTELCVCLADQVHTHFDIPIMAFQKPTDSTAILLPDVEFLENGYFENKMFIDTFSYEAKAIQAIFCGSTTGGAISKKTLSDGDLPRLRAAHYFHKSRLVDFRLPNIVQCVTPTVEDELRRLPFCRQPRLTLQEQLRSRFLISIDGNGAACSRLALALRSNSTLLKYDSPHLLFYSQGLRESVHYVPIRQDSDVVRVVAMELANPGLFRGIAESGAAFATKHLSRTRLRRYTSMLVTLYAHLSRSMSSR